MVLGLGFSGFRIRSFGFEGLGYRVNGFGFRVFWV